MVDCRGSIEHKDARTLVWLRTNEMGRDGDGDKELAVGYIPLQTMCLSVPSAVRRHARAPVGFPDRPHFLSRFD